MRVTTLAAAALFLAAACSQARAPEARALLWKVSDADNSVYLLGSFHALRTTDYPLPTTVDAAFADAEALAFEVTPAEMESPELARQMLAAARLPTGQTLSAVLPARTWKRLRDYCERTGKQPAAFEPFAPWFVSLSLTLAEMSRLGFDPALGLDRHLMARAADAAKPTSGLETAASQVRLLAGMPMATQHQFLDEFLDEAEDPKGSMDALHASWRRGDADAIEGAMVRELAEKYADLYRRINVDRNQAWLPKLRAMLDTSGDDDTLVVVGALHLVGKEGLVSPLTAKGYRVERL